MKILLAVDASLFSLAAAREVAHCPWPRGSLVRIIYVARRPRVLVKGTRKAPQSAISASQSPSCYAIAKAQAQFDTGADAMVTLESEVLHGDPKDVILKEAASWGADLIVLGSRGASGPERFLLGSVSEAVAKHAACPLEIVRPRFASEKKPAGRSE